MIDEANLQRVGIHCLILNSRKQYLVLKRSADDDHDPKHWDLPGGGIGQHEGISEGLKREVIEETGLSIKDINLIGAYTCDEGRLQLSALAYLESGQVRLSDEHSEYKWIDHSQLIKIDPAGLHLVAAKCFIEGGEKVTTYEELTK
ncbi:MAG: NUDIX domain-containing protein [Patescibacteria group bacterium]